MLKPHKITKEQYEQLKMKGLEEHLSIVPYDGIVVDYKTVAKLPNQDKIPFNYKIQLLAYAYAARKMGFEINRIRIVYGVKPTIKIPARCIVVTEEIDFTADKLINGTLQLIGETVLVAKNNPSLVHLLFKSLDLKQ